MNKSPQLTKKQIITETVRYYGKNPEDRRASTDANCHYYLNGKMCALGRCLINPEKLEDRHGGISASELFMIYRKISHRPVPFQEKYKGHEQAFWTDLQGLHDYSGYWNPTGGLSRMGKNRVKQLHKKWGVKPKTKLEIIDETVKYYGENPKEKRAVEHSSCKYLTGEGQMCAVGRCLVNPGAIQSFHSGTVTLLEMRLHDKGEEIPFKPEYKGHSVDFWRELQRLHDEPRNWNEERGGLSDGGKYTVAELRKTWKNK